MTEPILVRLCTTDDLDALGRREPHPNARYAEGHFERQQQGDYFFALAVRGDVQLGTSVLDCREDNLLQPELKSLWVYPESRRQGAARALTRFLEQQAIDLGFDEIFLRVDPQNAALQSRLAETFAGRRPCAPATLAEERATNPFLRITELRPALGLENASDAQVFGQLRSMKDTF